MAEQTLPQSPLRQEEAATTREEMDFDDHENDHEAAPASISLQDQDTAAPVPTTPSPARKTVSFQEAEGGAGADDAPPPAKPPRPLSPQLQAENTLIEAFPSIDNKVIKAVLQASGGQVEPAFNALLGMSDPDFQPEDRAAPPPQPPRPVQQPRAPMSQLEADEMYARQLAEQYGSTAPRSQNRYNQREPARRGPNQQPRPAYGDDEPERNFFDDELPEIGRNIQQGFFDTQKKVNSWISNFKKRIDGEESDDEDLYSASQSGSRQNTSELQGRQNFGASQADQLYGIQKKAEAQQRRSTEVNRYDADPHELGDDEFERLELRDEEAPPNLPPRTSSRKTANPDLFKPNTASAKPPQSGPVDEVEAAGEQTDPKARKWQPLTSVAPHPEEDNDPFSLGDDEEDKGDELRKEDTQRLKEAARNSISDAGAPPAKQMEESGRSGSKNLEAEELLSGKKNESSG